MQFPELNLPPQPASEEWLRETNDRDDVSIIIPLSVKEDGAAWAMAMMIFGEKAVTMVYHDIYSWNLFTEYSLNHEINVYIDDLLQPEVGVIREDARALQRLASDFGETILDNTRLGFAPYVDTDVGERMERLRENCNCNSISEPQVKLGPGLSAIESERVFMCANCSRAHGFEYEGRPVSRQDAFDANWVLEGETADGFFNTEAPSDYLLHSEGEPVGKLEHSIAFMNVVGGGLSNSFSAYNPYYQNSLVYVKEDILAGYLTWTSEADGTQSLQQVYTRDDYRRAGIAATLISTWEENFCEDEMFYVEKPNPKSRRLLDKLGYMEGSTEAVEHYLLLGLANDWEEGKERAESINATG